MELQTELDLTSEGRPTGQIGLLRDSVNSLTVFNMMAVAAHTQLCYHVKWNLNQITAEMHEMSAKESTDLTAGMANLKRCLQGLLRPSWDTAMSPYSLQAKWKSKILNMTNLELIKSSLTLIDIITMLKNINILERIIKQFGYYLSSSEIKSCAAYNLEIQEVFCLNFPPF